MLKAPQTKDPDSRKEVLFSYKLGVGILLCLFGIILLVGGFIVLNSDDIPPPDISDLTVPYPDVPDEENAYVVFLEVLHQFDVTEEEREVLQTLHEEGVDPELGKVGAILDQFQAPIASLEAGVARPRCIFPRPDSFNFLLPVISEALEASDILLYKVQFLLLEERYPEAVQVLETQLRFSNHILAEPESLIQLLVGYACLGLAHDSLEMVLMDEAVPYRLVAPLRDAFMKPEEFQTSLKKAFKSEFLFNRLALRDLDLVLELTDISSFDDLSWLTIMMTLSPDYTVQPNKTIALLAKIYRAHLSQVGKHYSEVDLGFEDEWIKQFQPLSWTSVPYPNFGGEELISYLYPSLSRTHLKSMFFTGEVAVTSTLIALREFQEQHGHPPESLADLVPEVMPSVPLDPFDGKPIRYVAEKGLLWLVGEDLIDQGGSRNIRTGEDGDPEDRRITEDMVWELTW
jgi:hypothetical protein